MCRSPAEHKKLTNFEYVLSVELQTVKFSLGYVTVVGQYEFVNLIKCYLSSGRKLIYSCGACCLNP